MFSLQVQIRNLTPTSHIQSILPSAPSQQCITIRFGPLQTDIIIPNPDGSAGKRLVLQMQMPEMQNLLATYAFGLFMQNQVGRFWCILSLEKLKVGEQYLSNGLIFYDDDRNICYNFGILIKLTQFNPKVPKNKAIQQNITAQPKALQVKQGPKNIKSFLDGRKNVQIPNKPKAPQKPQPFQPNSTKNTKSNTQSHSMNKKQNKITYGVTQYQPMKNNFTGPQSDDETGIYIPPVMQFTNKQQNPLYSIPEPQYNLQQNQTNKINTAFQSAQGQQTVPKFQTFENYSQFKEYNEHEITQQRLKQNQKLKREELRELARQQAQKEVAKKHNQIMIPVPNPKTGTYQLIPISKLTEAQLIQYAQKQKMAQEYKKHQQQERIKQQKKEQKRRKKMEHIGKAQKDALTTLRNQNIGAKNIQKQKISQRNEESSSSDVDMDEEQYYKPQEIKGIQKKQENVKKINQYSSQQNSEAHITSQDHNSQVQQDEYENENYQSDFESISNPGSLLKSKRSLQSSLSNSRISKKRKDQNHNELDVSQSQSMSDYGYSQDFDSFSQSLLSKNKKGGSISEISGSYTSMSQRK